MAYEISVWVNKCNITVFKAGSLKTAENKMDMLVEAYQYVPEITTFNLYLNEVWSVDGEKQKRTVLHQYKDEITGNMVYHKV